MDTTLELLETILSLQEKTAKRDNLEREDITLMLWYKEYLNQTLEKAIKIIGEIEGIKDNQRAYVPMIKLSDKEYSKLMWRNAINIEMEE